ncbi:pyridoxal phosphate-dependent aminotransferase [Tepidibacter aestuarii]|uniref:pyridoxal phosphate-dependent aminotransferase n=1 Tax=Tepidibacter aestuarii TaxID=2925782 RepID=UPI0020BF4AB5|nr:pyridoxal phosphate-dependent aminotransferase [Tepidibacter aestuarii]CAH2213652.1 Aspartate aminotransferase [Tepidibacter aestuarii]CAH2215658.1 Aspartate aminotransferase [Tepidibacter aestuarii]
MELSIKHSNISSSLTLAISAKAKKMQEDGIKVISFSVGEPDFNTPENIRNKAIDVIQNNNIGYTAASGMPALKNAICNKLKVDNNLVYNSKEIIVSNGAKHSLYNIFQAICNPEDEVIISTPYWVSYPELVKMAGAKPILIDCDEDNDFKYNIDDLKKNITHKTKAIILTSPSNPTGSVYTLDELKQIAELAVKNNIIVVSDEIYEKLIYDNQKHISIASLNEKIKELTIVVNGLSKCCAMTGWRIGYTASNEKIAIIMSNIQSHATSNPNTIAQYAAIEALEGDQSAIEYMRNEFDQRRKKMVELINDIPNISCNMPKGAFYVMVNISKVIGKKLGNYDINSSMDFANYLLENSHVAVVPGVAFGNDNYIRLSYATSQENIIEGLNRIKEALSNI